MIYLDSAATTLQKPKSVLQAMQRAAARYASPGRGGYPAAMEAAEGILTEEEAMDLLEAVSQQPQPEKRSSTQWSCVYNQSRGTVFIAMGMDYDHLYQFSIWD